MTSSSSPSRSVARSPLVRALVLGLASVLTLAGCMKLDYTATLTPDDTVSWTMIMATSDDLATQLGMDPKDLWDAVGQDATSDLPQGATAEDYAQDGYTGVRLTAVDQPLESASDPEALTFTREGDEFVVSGQLDLSGSDAELDTTDPSTQEMLQEFQVHFSVTFPGAVGATNGTVQGQTVTWSPAYGEVTQLEARGSAIASGAQPSVSESSASPSDEVSAEASASPSQEASPSEGASPSDATTADATTAGAATTASSGFPAWVLAAIGIVLLAAVGTVVALVVRQRGAARRAEVAGAPGDLPAWQGPEGAQDEPAPVDDTAVDPTPVADTPAAPPADAPPADEPGAGETPVEEPTSDEPPSDEPPSDEPPAPPAGQTPPPPA